MTLTEFLKRNPATSSRIFGDFIRVNREERGLSLRAYAAELGISVVYLSDIEKGARPATTKMMEIFKNNLGITQAEEDAFYDMAKLTRGTIAPEIIQYLIANPDARKAIQTARKKNIDGEKVLKAIENIEDNMELSNS